MANRFKLTSLLTGYDNKDNTLKNYYKSWRMFNQKSKSSFTALDNSFFTDYLLKDLESGPLRLYLYFSYVANNDYGHSWHSIQKIADYFDAQTRTIDNWIKVLVDKELIYRAQKGHKSNTTYIIPYSNTLIHHTAPKKRSEDNQDLLDDLLNKIKESDFIYGEVIRVYHLFQWTSNKGKPVRRDNSTQMLLIITQRKNGVLIGHMHILRKSEHLAVSELEIEEHSIFKSPYLFNGANVTGIALTPYPSIRTNSAIKDLIDLVEELASIEEWKLKDRPELKYGDKDELLPFDEEDNEKKEENDEIGVNNEQNDE